MFGFAQPHITPTLYGLTLEVDQSMGAGQSCASIPHIMNIVSPPLFFGLPGL